MYFAKWLNIWENVLRKHESFMCYSKHRTLHKVVSNALYLVLCFFAYHTSVHCSTTYYSEVYYKKYRVPLTPTIHNFFGHQRNYLKIQRWVDHAIKEVPNHTAYAVCGNAPSLYQVYSKTAQFSLKWTISSKSRFSWWFISFSFDTIRHGMDNYLRSTR